MPSIRESALIALYNLLQTLSPAYMLYRNHDKPIVSQQPVVVLRDGESNEPDVLLSPLRYIYEHHARIEVMVEHSDQAIRDTLLDNAITTIGTLLLSQPTLNNAVEWMEAQTSDIIQEPLEGAVTVKAAIIPVMLRFHTINPLL